MEPGGGRRHGVAALPLPVSVLRRPREALVPALSAQRGHVPRRPVQYRELRALDAHGGPCHGSGTGRVRAYARRRPSVSEPPRSSARAADPHAAPPADAAAESGGAVDLRFHVRRYRDRGLSRPSAYQSAGSRVISLVVAYAAGRVIGNEGRPPWHLPDDMRHFKALTIGQTVVMGRKTLDAIGRPLPRRRNVVLTHRAAIEMPGIDIVHSVQEALALGDIFVIGGAQVYALFLPFADRLYLTEIACEIEGDTFFPEWDRGSFTLVHAEEGVLDERNTL